MLKRRNMEKEERKRKNKEEQMGVVYQLPHLAFVFLITQAKTDVNVALAVLGQVLSLHQGDTQHLSPHLVL